MSASACLPTLADGCQDALDVAIALIRTICTTLARLNYAAAQCIRDAVAANGLQHLHTLSQPLLLLIATIVVLLAMLDLFGAIAAMPMPVLLILSVLLWMLLP